MTRARPNARRREQEFQIALVRLLNVALTPETRFFHVPNGGYRTKAEGGILKAMGVKPGMFDLVFLHRLNFGDISVCCAFGLELKSADGDLDENQREVHADLAQLGMPIGVAHTIDEALEQLRMWCIPLRLKDETASRTAA